MPRICGASEVIIYFMFNKLKQFKDLRQQAKTLQNALANESVTVEKNGINITINGNMEITQININENLAKESLEKILTELINQAIKKIKMVMAEKIQQIKGVPSVY